MIETPAAAFDRRDLADKMRPPMAAPPDDEALGLLCVLDDGGDARPGAPLPGDELLRAMYREMLRIRRIDERMLTRQRQGRVGFYGTITGQEATPVAAGFALGPDDWVFPALREAAIMLVRGFPLERWLAQVYGNAGDVLKGRQMPSHMSSRDVHQVAWSSCIGPQLPQAVGAAMAARHRGDAVVVMGFMGDGATSEGDFHHAMDFAARFHPPVVLVCQNNQWSISVPVAKQTAAATIAVKARAYGLRGVRVDGNDVLAVHGALSDAVERARAGDGPTFVEALTYRIGPHSSSDDPTRYRSEDEVEVWRGRDPIARLERFLERRGVLDEAGRDAIRAALDEEIGRALDAVEPLPPPDRATLFDDVVGGALPPHLRSQRDALLASPPGKTH